MTGSAVSRLGIRAALLTSTATSAIQVMLAADPDVKTVERWEPKDNPEIWEASAVDIVISEIHLPTPSMTADQLGILRNQTMLVSLGSPGAAYATLPNVEHLRHGSFSDFWPMLKYKLLERRLQELSRMALALSEEVPAQFEDEITMQLETTNGTVTVPVSEIEWARAAGNYVELRVGRQLHLVRMEMYMLERQVPGYFVRIHRKMLINLRYLVRIEKLSSMRWFVRLRSGERFAIGRNRRHQVRVHWETSRQTTADKLSPPEVICHAAIRNWPVQLL